MNNIEKYAYTVIHCRFFELYGKELKNVGFMKGLREHGFFEKDKDEAFCPQNDIRIVPDGFYFDEENKELYIYEIEDTSLLTWNKMVKLWMLSEQIWDEKLWRMHVFVVDRYGANERKINIDLVELVIAYNHTKKLKKAV